MLKTRSGLAVGRIGQGSWCFGEVEQSACFEADSLRAGLAQGMNLIDTAGMYGQGGAEEVIGQAIEGMARDDLYLVSKIYPHNANKNDYLTSCQNSLRRLRTDYLDLYLLHWRGMTPLSEVVDCMEDLKKRGLILNWGVSNFDIDDMEELFALDKGKNCIVNQVLYHLGSRGIEYSLLPWQEAHGIITMAYCPLAQAGALKRGLYENQVLKSIAKSHGASLSQILLAFLLTKPLVLPIPRTSRPERAIENAQAMSIRLSDEELLLLDQAFPPPKRKLPLDIE